MFVTNVDEHCLLMVIFSSKVGVGMVKYHATEARKLVAEQLRVAQDRDPSASLDLSVLNLADPSELFKRKA